MSEPKKNQGDRDTVTGYDFTIDDPLTPAKAIRKACLHCVGDERGEVRKCTAHVPTKQCDPGGCWRWPYRMGKGFDDSRGDKWITRIKAIRKECLNCMGGDRELVRTCTTTDCFLWPYRMGKRPVKAEKGHVAAQLTAKKAKTEVK